MGNLALLSKMKVSEADAMAFEKAMIENDLKSLSTVQRLGYYKAVCDSVALNYLTRPFEYIVLNGKLTLYANKNCAEQLRENKKISIESIDKQFTNDLYIVTVSGSNGEGRKDSDQGVVSIKGLSGENLANALMKCLTKAKRRFTLSISGLGMMDETEIEDIPAEHKQPFVENPFDNMRLEKEIRQAEEIDPVAQPDPDDMGEYVIKIGAKHRGKRLKDMDMFELDGYLNWMHDEAKKKNKPLDGDWLELAQIGEEYLKSKEVKR